MKTKMNKLKTVLTMLLAAAGIGARAQAPDSLLLTLENCRTMALDSSRLMKGYRLTEEMARHKQLSLRTNYFPSLSLQGAYYYTTDPLTYRFGGLTLPGLGLPLLPPFALSLDPAHTYAAGAVLKQPVFAGGKIIAANRMADIGVQMAALNREKTRTEILVEVEEAFWLCIKADRLREAARLYEEAVEETRRCVEDFRELGLATENDRQRVAVEMNRARLMRSQAENGYRLSRMNLCHKIGLPLHTPVRLDTAAVSALLPDGLSPFPDSTGPAGRYDYRLLEKQVEMKEREADLVRSDFLPRIGIAASYGYADGLRLQDRKLLEQDAVSAVATVSIPLFHWGEGYHKILAARNEAALARNELERLSEQMELEQASEFYAMQDASYRMELAASAVRSSETGLKSARDRYEFGKAALSEVLEAQLIWQQAITEQIEAESAYRIRRLKFQKSIGTL